MEAFQSNISSLLPSKFLSKSLRKHYDELCPWFQLICLESHVPLVELGVLGPMFFFCQIPIKYLYTWLHKGIWWQPSPKLVSTGASILQRPSKIFLTQLVASNSVRNLKPPGIIISKNIHYLHGTSILDSQTSWSIFHLWLNLKKCVSDVTKIILKII